MKLEDYGIWVRLKDGRAWFYEKKSEYWTLYENFTLSMVKDYYDNLPLEGNHSGGKEVNIALYCNGVKQSAYLNDFDPFFEDTKEYFTLMESSCHQDGGTFYRYPIWSFSKENL